jgi:hypothetical protein
VLHGARVGLVGVIGRSARRIDSAGVATQAQGIILTVSFVDSAGPRAASPLPLPGAGSRRCRLLGARRHLPPRQPLRRARSVCRPRLAPAPPRAQHRSRAHEVHQPMLPAGPGTTYDVPRYSVGGRSLETVDAMLPGRRCRVDECAVGGASFAAVLSLAAV